MEHGVNIDYTVNGRETRANTRTLLLSLEEGSARAVCSLQERKLTDHPL